jgi:hypothetical protein
MRQRYLAIGHSHIIALMAAWADSQSTTIELGFVRLNSAATHDPKSIHLLQGGALNQQLVQRINTFGPSRLLLLLGGNTHNMFGLVQHPEPFDFVLAEQPDLPVAKVAAVIPAGAVRAELEARLAGYGHGMSRLRKAYANLPMSQLESPPPIPSEAHIRQHPGIFAEAIAKDGVAPATLRYKLWRLHSAIFKDMCARSHVGFLPVPAATQDSQGMMRQEAWSSDRTHGNTWYGAHVIAQIERS